MRHFWRTYQSYYTILAPNVFNLTKTFLFYNSSFIFVQFDPKLYSQIQIPFTILQIVSITAEILTDRIVLVVRKIPTAAIQFIHSSTGPFDLSANKHMWFKETW